MPEEVQIGPNGTSSVHNGSVRRLFTGTGLIEHDMHRLPSFRDFPARLILQARKENVSPVSKTKTKYPNHLSRYRERLGYTREQVAELIGCKRGQTIRRMESGKVAPGVVTVLRLSAALRTPVEFLYQDTYSNLRDEVRATEERMPKGRQGVLPLLV